MQTAEEKKSLAERRKEKKDGKIYRRKLQTLQKRRMQTFLKGREMLQLKVCIGKKEFPSWAACKSSEKPSNETSVDFGGGKRRTGE